jgi:hypothetical protein
MQREHRKYVLFVLLPLASACGDDGTVGDSGPGPDGSADATTDSTLPDGGGGETPTYWFDSRFAPGENSVEHPGQTTRQLLVLELVTEMERLSEGVLDGSIEPTMVDEPGEVTSRLNAFYRGGSTDLAGRPLTSRVSEDDTMCQTSFSDLGTADLFAKTAGQDTVTDHRDWSTEFVGWSDATVLGGAAVDSPTALLDAFLSTFEAQVSACAIDVSSCPETAAGDPLPLYVTPDGLHLAELVEKHLFGAVHFSQGTDDYLDDDVADKGLLSDNTMPEEDGSLSTTLEHAWDEAFGYFGAAADYDTYADEEIRGEGGRPDYQGYHDTDANGCIDLFDEFNYPLASYTAARDLGATTPLDLTAESFDAFVAGRTLIAEAPGALSSEQATELAGYRDAAVSGWERGIAATVIHYMNAVIDDMNTCGTAEYSFESHAGHWSEMKGFALSVQYNPRSPWNDGSDFAALHASIGDSPVLCDGDTSTYLTTLLAARDTIRDAYGFDMGDAEGW